MALTLALSIFAASLFFMSFIFEPPAIVASKCVLDESQDCLTQWRERDTGDVLFLPYIRHSGDGAVVTEPPQAATPTQTFTPTPSLTPTVTPTLTHCSVYPITVGSAIRSLTDPDDAFALDSDFPEASQFDYPNSPPVFADFPDHTPDITLVAAEEGDLFLLHHGMDPADFNWLTWNEFKENSTANLVDSLIFPGNSTDHVTSVDRASPYWNWNS